MMNNSPNYKQIFIDILDIKFPEKRKFCEKILNKKNLNTLDIIELNQIVFHRSGLDENISNAKHKSYDVAAKQQIISYQRKFKLTNTQAANHFKLSRNTIAAWKKNKHL